METKKCFKCSEIKPIIYFYKDCQKKSGIKSNCKKCESEKQKLIRNNNPDKCKIWYLNSKQKTMKKIIQNNKSYNYISRSSLNNRYIKQILKNNNLPLSLDIIEYKKQQIILKRTIKQLKNEVY